MSHPHMSSTWSQLGEDALLAHLFKHQEGGFYVDVGAFHPEMYSNTRLLHGRGWSGVNIDLSEKTVSMLRRARPDDVSVRAAVSDFDGEATAYVFNGGQATVNTLDKEFADAWSAKSGLKYEQEKVRVARLDTLLSEHAPGRTIDFLNIDVEGLEMKVLGGANVDKIRPKVLAVEIHAKDVREAADSEVAVYLRSVGYRFAAHCVITSIFVLDR